MTQLKFDSSVEETFEKQRRLASRFLPDTSAVHVVIVCARHEFKAKVLNYHFGGASLKLIEENDLKLFSELKNQNPRLDFYFGSKCLKKGVPFRVAWESLNENATFGIQFLKSAEEWLSRSSRFGTHKKIKPQIDGFDPIDPNRRIYFAVENVSASGMLLSTSMTNKHLFPGMELNQMKLQVPGSDPISVNLVIENTRVEAEDSSEFQLGVSIRGGKDAYLNALKTYLVALSPSESFEARARELKDGGFRSKQIKEFLSFRIVDNALEYEKVLKLRFLGYSHHGKVKQGTDWKSQGEGLRNEGTILGAYVGAQLVGAMELRFGAEKVPLRFLRTDSDIEKLGLIKAKLVEVNKLVLHPDIQGTDVVLGMIQKVHSICVARGGLDIIMAATSKLAPLYLRAGAEKTGHSFPHPFLQNESLEILLGRHEVYFGQESLNPLVWETIYAAVHESYVKFGFSKPFKKDLTWYLRKYLTEFALKLKNKTLPKKSKTTDYSRDEDKVKEFIDPKWTAQHIVASILLPYLAESDEIIGKEKTNKILSEIGIPRNYFNSQTNWLSVQFLDEFLGKYASYGSVDHLSVKAGERSMKKDMIGVNYYLLKHFVSPAKASLALATIANRFNRTRTYRAIRVDRFHATLAVGINQGYRLPKHRESCKNFEASFRSYVELCTGNPGHVVHTHCCYDGAEECVFEVGWKTNKKVLTEVLEFSAVGGIALLATLFSSIYTGVVATLVGSLFVLIRKYATQRSELEALEAESDIYQKDTAEKYAELQQAKTDLDHRYREAVLLENISKELQKSQETTKLLRVALDSSCELLNFSRGFLMLVDEQKQFLKTAAVHGVNSKQADLWSFKVDVSVTRENPLLLSSVFKSGNPVMIENVDAQKFQLNAASRQLIEQLGSKSFLMVPIPSSMQTNWGVIVTDKANREERLSRKDIVLLSRVAQSLGLALDKQAKLDQEARLRQTFQKFVPAPVLDSLESNATPVLGGVTKEIFCMFLDIRGFTSLSQSLPPQGLIHMLNSVFGMVQKEVSHSGGHIEKFLGDGILMSWGSISVAPPTAAVVFDSAKKVLLGIERINKMFESQGLPEIRIGLGLHFGPAVVGNIGSSERMEFTSIGQTVNMAARLESLCKEYQSELICSSKVLAQLPENDRANFEVKEDVMIRGIAEPQTIGLFKRDAQSGASENSKIKVA